MVSFLCRVSFSRSLVCKVSPNQESFESFSAAPTSSHIPAVGVPFGWREEKGRPDHLGKIKGCQHLFLSLHIPGSCLLTEQDTVSLLVFQSASGSCVRWQGCIFEGLTGLSLWLLPLQFISVTWVCVADRPFAYTMYNIIKNRLRYFLWATIFIWWWFLLCSAISNVLVLFQNMIKQNEELFDTALF